MRARAPVRDRGPTMAEGDAEVIEFAAERAAREAARPRCVAVGGRPCRNYAVIDGLCRVHARSLAAAASGGAASAGASASFDASTDVPSGARDEDPGTTTGAGAPPGRDTSDDDLPPADPDGWARLVRLLEVARMVAGEGWPDLAAGAADFLRRRLAGDYEIDDFGFDEDLTTSILMPLVRPLHRHYWRVSSTGTQNIPREGGGMIVANHAGTLPADALITRLDILDATGRHARELGADLVFRTPFVGEFARKTGATLAAGPDADRLLAQGELVAVWPEGYKGLGKPWKDRYKLQRFGRGGFVATALRARVPIIPTAIVGSEEIYPLIHDLRIVARVLGLPYFPIVPQMFALPILGPLALLPLPSKWVIEYGEPIDTSGLGPEAADDPMAVFDLTDRIRSTIQSMIDRLVTGRRSVFL